MRQDVQERLALIESMMLEGRRKTEYWGWSFVLWGVAYLVAMGWSYMAKSGAWAWPVTMVAAGLITAAVSAVRQRGKPETTVGRGIGGVWSAVGCAIFLFCFSAAISGHLEVHAFVGAVAAFLGVANFVSGTILRWRLQQVLACMWWTAGAAVFFMDPQNILITVIVCIFLGNICFGIYLMIRESRDKAKARPAQVIHA